MRSPSHPSPACRNSKLASTSTQSISIWLRDEESNLESSGYGPDGLARAPYSRNCCVAIANRGPDANPAFRFWAARCYFRTEKVLRPLTATAGQFTLPGHSALSCTSPVHSPLASTLAFRLAATSHAMRARLLRAATRAKSSETLWPGCDH